MERSIVRDNLMERAGYSPYCGNDISKYKVGGCNNPRSVFNGSQFHCSMCGWLSEFPEEFIKEYKAKWGLK